jgi:thymidylate synthase (FAD)
MNGSSNHEVIDRHVLDHGFVRHVESWGCGDNGIDNEAGIIEAARQSTQGSFRGWEEDEKLLRHLYNNNHSTPFEFAGMVIEVQAPIFVFREWHRHRTQSYNEMSARYAPLPDLNYMPTYERLMIQNTANKQANGTGKELTALDAQYTLLDLNRAYRQAQQDYISALDRGVPKELARCFLPVARYSKMRASANLRNWLAFLTLRMDPNAQWEIQQYAQAVAGIIEDRFPKTYKLFMERSK